MLRNAHFLGMQAMPLSDQDLATHNIDTSDHFSDGVLDLNARVHLDKEPLVSIQVVKEFNRARAVIANRLRDLHRSLTKLGANLVRQTY